MSEPTFEISADGKAITCKKCGRTSHNENDVRHKYCGHCHVFHGQADGKLAELNVRAADALEQLQNYLKEKLPDVKVAVFAVVPPDEDGKPCGIAFATSLYDDFLVRMLRHYADAFESGQMGNYKWDPTETGNS